MSAERKIALGLQVAAALDSDAAAVFGVDPAGAREPETGSFPGAAAGAGSTPVAEIASSDAPRSAEERPVPRRGVPDVDRVAASRRAVEARQERARVRAAVTTGALSPLGVLEEAVAEPTGAIGRMRVHDLLTAMRGVGEGKATRLMAECGIARVKRLGGLGHRQGAALREHLRARMERVPDNVKPPARLFVLAGPTAVGKGTVSAYIREHYPEVHFSVSATTRPPRPGEIDGVHYHFVTRTEFEAMVASGDMLEWAQVHNQHLYGTPRGPVDEALGAGRPVLLEIDIQGARQVRRAAPDCLLIFLQPPNWQELVRRLTGRGTESVEEQTRRLATAQVELAAAKEFDFEVVNATVPEAAREVVELMGFPKE